MAPTQHFFEDVLKLQPINSMLYYRIKKVFLGLKIRLLYFTARVCMIIPFRLLDLVGRHHIINLILFLHYMDGVLKYFQCVCSEEAVQSRRSGEKETCKKQQLS